MTKFIHISDLHIHKDNKKDDNVNCKLLINKIIERYTNDVKILITGDIVDDGHVDQYKNAVEILKPLVENNFSLLAVPGNHDYGPFGNFYTEKSQKLFQKYILGDLLGDKKAKKEAVHMEDIYPITTVAEDAIFIGVDSVVGNEDEKLHFASGEVGEKQRETLKAILHENKDLGKQIVVYFHHHPFNRNFVMEMDDAKEVLRLLAGIANFVCFGHDHDSQDYNCKNQIDWILASGKSTQRNKDYKLQFREVSIKGNEHSVAMYSFG